MGCKTIMGHLFSDICSLEFPGNEEIRNAAVLGTIIEFLKIP